MALIWLPYGTYVVAHTPRMALMWSPGYHMWHVYGVCMAYIWLVRGAQLVRERHRRHVYVEFMLHSRQYCSDRAGGHHAASALHPRSKHNINYKQLLIAIQFDSNYTAHSRNSEMAK